MSTRTSPVTPKGQATHKRLLSAARDLAIANVGHLEIADVAAAAGVVPSLIHRYFGSKAGLVGALIDDFYDRFHAEVFALELEQHGDWAEHERLRLEAGVRFHYKEPFSVVLYGQLAREPDVARREAERTAAIVHLGARSIRKAQKSGELPVGTDPGIAAAAMFGAMRLVMVEVMTRSPRPRPERVIDALWLQIAASVRIDPETGLPRTAP